MNTYLLPLCTHVAQQNISVDTQVISKSCTSVWWRRLCQELLPARLTNDSECCNTPVVQQHIMYKYEHVLHISTLCWCVSVVPFIDPSPIAGATFQIPYLKLVISSGHPQLFLCKRASGSTRSATASCCCFLCLQIHVDSSYSVMQQWQWLEDL